MAELLELDKLSFDILWLLITNKELRFNQLYRILTQCEIKFSKPTLVDRLNVLIEKNLITRSEEGPQKVIYRANEEKFHLAKNFQEEYKKIIKHYEKVNLIEKDLPLKDTVEWFLSSIFLTYLYELKLKIVTGLPLTILDDERDSLVKDLFSMPYENVLIENCIKSEECRKMTLETLDEIIEQYRGMLIE